MPCRRPVACPKLLYQLFIFFARLLHNFIKKTPEKQGKAPLLFRKIKNIYDKKKRIKGISIKPRSQFKL
jgi:hypothetical protein